MTEKPPRDNPNAGNWRFDSVAVRLLRLQEPERVTISGGQITITSSYVMVDTESGASSDLLATINAYNPDHLFVILVPADGARTIILDHAADNIYCAGNADFDLDDADDFAILVRNRITGHWMAAPSSGVAGPQGPPGADGMDGAQGELGPPGATGATGAAGATGEAGAQGAASTVMGPPGADGLPGEDRPMVGIVGAPVVRYIQVRVLDSATSHTVAALGGDFVIPVACSLQTPAIAGVALSNVGVTVDTAGTTGTGTFDIKKNATTIFSTLITLDTTEKTSRTAAAVPVLTNALTTFAVGDILTFHVTVLHTTAAKGLTFWLNVMV